MFVPKKIIGICICFTCIIGFWAFRWWHSRPPYYDQIVLMIPGLDNTPAKRGGRRGVTELDGYYRSFGVGIFVTRTGSWPGFRGPGRNNNVVTAKPMPDWDVYPPEVIWTVTLGEGHASSAVHRGKVYVLDYDERRRMDLLRCFVLEDGSELWQRGYSNPIKRNHGFSRSIPAVDDDVVVTIGPMGHLLVCNTDNGEFRWGRDLTAETGCDIPLWYASQCPLLFGSQIVVAIGSEEILMAGFDKLSGETLWSAPNFPAVRMSHSSIMAFEIEEELQFVYSGIGGLCGISAETEDMGRLLWFQPWDAAVVVPSPVYTGEGRIFQTAGYGAGSLLFRVVRSGEDWETTILASRSPLEGTSSEQQTPVFDGDRLFSILPKDAGPRREQLVLSDPEGSVIFSSGPDQRFGLGPYLLVGGDLLVLRDDGFLFRIEIKEDEFEITGKVKLIDGVDAWGPLAWSDGYLLARDSRNLVCVDMGNHR